MANNCYLIYSVLDFIDDIRKITEKKNYMNEILIVQ